MPGENAMLWDAETLQRELGRQGPWQWPPSMNDVMDMQDIVWRLAIRITQVSIAAGSETKEKPFQEKLHAVASRIFACFSTSMLDWEIEREHTQSNAQTNSNFHIDITSTASMLIPHGGPNQAGFRRWVYPKRVIELKRRENDQRCLEYWRQRLYTFHGGMFNENDRFVLVNYGPVIATMWLLNRPEYVHEEPRDIPNNRVKILGDYDAAISDIEHCFGYLEGRLKDVHYAGVWEAMVSVLDAISRVDQAWWMNKAVNGGRQGHWREKLLSYCDLSPRERPDCKSSECLEDDEQIDAIGAEGLQAVQEARTALWERMRGSLKKGIEGVSAVQPRKKKKRQQGGQRDTPAAKAKQRPKTWEERIAAAGSSAAEDGSGTREQDLRMESDDELEECTKNPQPGDMPSCPQAKRVLASEGARFPFAKGVIVQGFHGQTVFYHRPDGDPLKTLQAENVLDILNNADTKAILAESALQWFTDAKVRCRVPYGVFDDREDRDKYKGMLLVLYGRDSFGMYEMIDEGALDALEREMCAILKRSSNRAREAQKSFIGYSRGGTCIRHDVNTAWQRGQVERALRDSFLGGVDDIMAQITAATAGQDDGDVRAWVSELVQEAMQVRTQIARESCPVCACSTQHAGAPCVRWLTPFRAAGARHGAGRGGPDRPGQAGRHVGVRAVADVGPGGWPGPRRAGQGLDRSGGGGAGGRHDREVRGRGTGVPEAAK